MLYGLSNLRTDVLGDAVIHCEDENELQNALTTYRLSKIIIVCHSDELIGLDILLLDYPIDTLIVLNNDQDNDIREWLVGLIFNNIIEVQTEKQLMRRLCTTIVFYYHNQSTEYREMEDHGMASLCILDSLKALDYSTNFI